MRHSKAKIIFPTSKCLGNCPILVAKYETVHQTIFMVIKKNILKVYIQSDSQEVVNVTNRKIDPPEEIINTVENIRWIVSWNIII